MINADVLAEDKNREAIYKDLCQYMRTHGGDITAVRMANFILMRDPKNEDAKWIMRQYDLQSDGTRPLPPHELAKLYEASK